ncbi:MAG: hypothetical protein IJY62_05925 [Clostridia bacterium]|nr:hypothetical protein [Clostridia bacterium]
MKKDKYYYEKLCKTMLELKYREKFYDLKLCDKPDLQNSSASIGIEVTRAIFPNEGELLAFVNKNLSNKYSELSQKLLQKLGFENPPIKEGFFFVQKNSTGYKLLYFKVPKSESLILFGMISPLENINSCLSGTTKSIKDKITKLKNNYFIFGENDLILVIEEQLNYLALSEEIKSDLIHDIINIIKQEYALWQDNEKYEYVYILFLDNLVEIDCRNWEYQIKTITQEDWNFFATQIS